MSDTRGEPSQFQIAGDYLREQASAGQLGTEARNLRVMILELVRRIESLTARVGELEHAARDARAGEHTIDAETSRSLPHQP